MIRIVVAIAIVLGSGTRGHAQEAADTQSYRVRQGDTLELVAAEFYGDRNDALFVMVENKLQRARALRPGERLKIPVTREITTAKGDTFELLAGTYLGDARRATVLADFNNMAADDTIATGTTLTIPFHVTHVALATETLASISTLYFGDAKHAELLQSYNNLDKSWIEKGESLVVPVLHVRVRAQKLPPPDAESKARREQQHAVATAVAIALPLARTAWLEGDFATVRATLGPLGEKIDYLDTPSVVEVGVLFGRALVAFDDTAGAVTAFTHVLDRDARYELSRYVDSPKVLAAWKKAGGHVEGE